MSIITRWNFEILPTTIACYPVKFANLIDVCFRAADDTYKIELGLNSLAGLQISLQSHLTKIQKSYSMVLAITSSW